MNKYLLQILHEVNTIIIPGLGALTVTNSKTGEIMFMSFLKHEDGKLAKYISENDGISENDAKNLIAKYVREILAELDKGESYDMYQFGRFIKVNGEVEFENWNKYNDVDSNAENVIVPAEVKTEAKIIDLVPETKIENEVVEEKIEEIEKPKNLDEILAEKPIEEVKSEEIPEVVEVVSEKVEEESAVADDITSVSVTQEELVKEVKDEKKTEEIKNVAEKVEAVKQTPVQKVEVKREARPSVKVKKDKSGKKKSKGFYLIIILAVFLIVGGASTAIFYDKIQEKFFAKTEVISENEIDSTDENLEQIENQVELSEEDSLEIAAKKELSENLAQVEEEKAMKEEKKANKAQVVAETFQTSSGLSYHIISGGFGVEENANRQAKKFQDEGKNASVLGKFDNMYLVAYESFATKEEATNALKGSAVKGWIFKYAKK